MYYPNKYKKNVKLHYVSAPQPNPAWCIGNHVYINNELFGHFNINIFGKPIGNDEARGKCTYVTKYGLEVAKQTLNKITKEAIENRRMTIVANIRHLLCLRSVCLSFAVNVLYCS